MLVSGRVWYIICFNNPMIDGDASQTVKKFKRFITSKTTFQRFLLERLDSISCNFVCPMCIHTYVQVFRLLPLMKQWLGIYICQFDWLLWRYEGMGSKESVSRGKDDKLTVCTFPKWNWMILKLISMLMLFLHMKTRTFLGLLKVVGLLDKNKISPKWWFNGDLPW